MLYSSYTLWFVPIFVIIPQSVTSWFNLALIVISSQKKSVVILKSALNGAALPQYYKLATLTNYSITSNTVSCPSKLGSFLYF